MENMHPYKMAVIACPNSVIYFTSSDEENSILVHLQVDSRDTNSREITLYIPKTLKAFCTLIDGNKCVNIERVGKKEYYALNVLYEEIVRLS